MATMAALKKERQLQLGKVIAALRTYDTAQEKLERLLKRYRNKKKIIEPEDIAPVDAAFRAMNGSFSAIERELANLATVVRI